MSKLRELVRQGGSRWYVIVAILTGLNLAMQADPRVTVPVDEIFRAVGWRWTINSGYKPELLSDSEFERIKAGPAFARMQTKIQDLSSAFESEARAEKALSVLCVILVTGYLGFSLDAGYKWLRKFRRYPSET